MECGAGACFVGGAHFLYGVEWDALGVFLLINFTVAVDVDYHFVAQCIDARYAYTVQTSGYLVAAFVELAAGVQDGHDYFEGRAMLFLMHVHWNAATVVFDGDAVVFINANVYFAAIACQGFVDGVVYHLVDKVVQAAEVDVADVHGGAHTDGFEAFENGDVAGTVIVLSLLFFAHSMFCKL